MASPIIGRRAFLPARLIAVGDELLAGRTTDTNSGLVARALLERGIRVERIWIVPDRAEAIAEALAATASGDLVILTGGLGSTPDDLTREAVASWAGVPLREHPEARRLLERLAVERGLRWPGLLERQTMVPQGLAPVPNPAGSAPGLVGSLRGRALVLLPGVPSEARALLPGALARLAAAGLLPEPQPGLLLRTTGIAETALATLCGPVLAAHPGLQWSWNLARWGVDLNVLLPPEAADPEPLLAAGAELRERLGRAIWADRPVELPEVVLGLAAAAGVTLAAAESCTGGLVGARLTEPAGASAVFRGGIVAYADEIKQSALEVPAALLREHGAVSGPVAEAMAAGCRRRLGADLAVAVTGIAGPSGGSEAKPVGTTWLALAGPGWTLARGLRFPGQRARNRQLAAAAALDLLRRRLEAPAAPVALPTDSWALP